jgi:mannosyltransferase
VLILSGPIRTPEGKSKMSFSHGITTTWASPGPTVPTVARRGSTELEMSQTTDVVYLTRRRAEVWHGQTCAGRHPGPMPIHSGATPSKGSERLRTIEGDKSSRRPSAPAWRVLLSARVGWLAVGLLVFVAAILTTHAIGAKSLWLDEGLSARIAQLDPGSGVSATYSTPTPGAIVLYYLLLHFWSTVGSDETWLRLLSAVFAVASIPFIYLLGNRLIGRAAGVTAATVVAFSPFVVSQAQQARPYGLVIFLSTILSLIFLSAMRGGGLRIWLLYAAAAIAGVYAHTTVAYLIAAQGGVAGIELVVSRQRPWPKVASRVAAGAIIVLACLPLTGQFSAEGLAGVPTPTFENVGVALYRLTGGATLLAVTSIGVLAIPLFGWHWLRRGRGLEFSILMAASVVPIALELLISLRRPMFIERYLTMAIPGLALVVASAVDFLATWRPSSGGAFSRPPWMSPTVVRLVACALIVVLSVRSVGAAYTGFQEDWRGAVEIIASKAQPGDDVVLYPPYARLPFDYYASRQPIFRALVPIFPNVSWDQYFPASGPSLATSLSDAKRDGRVWIVYRSGDGVAADDANLIATFLSCGTTQADDALQGVRVVLVDLTGCGVAG